MMSRSDGDHPHKSSNIVPDIPQDPITIQEVKEVQAMVKNIMENTKEPLPDSDRNWPSFASLIAQA